MIKFKDYENKYHSRHAGIIVFAYALGYRFDFDKHAIIRPNGNIVIPKRYGKQKYPCISFNSNEGIKRNLNFNIHKFVAYQLYGISALGKGVNVRHLDANRLNLSKENIAIGTSSDNHKDVPITQRKAKAKHARASQGKRPPNTKISDELAKSILLEYLDIKGNRQRALSGTVSNLAIKYTTARATIQSICSGHSFPDIYEEVLKERSNESK